MEQRQFLSFGLAEELYALPLGQVREIIPLPPITRLPGAPDFLRGVVNLRGAILPLVDLRQELGLPAQPYGKFTVVIVAEAAGLCVGLVVDRVLDVLALGEAELEAPPAPLAARVRADFVMALARVEGSLAIVLDIARILTDEQIGILRAASAA